ncbi:CpsD/CapB family tyrosine-protein kinase [Cytobacillus luteolus]|uniref:CpsD/CapB family tyrosine-protein kinase n=1 Tax=Litchfieldia luteola TaxID=682179 RepID=UPI001CAAFDBC|nr:CpsD/CapB family tyrosine-protein kinase [Cytobacillus luteolus]MBP1943287.1 capsular exopolysaccharide synthesis family protein [Cytobacillus luteolus]
MRVKKNRKEAQLIAHRYPKLPITEQYRQIRSSIIFSAIERDIRSLIITSPEPGDGKTTTAINLAIVLAQQDKKVLLIDADLRNPSIHHNFLESNNEGLVNVLAKTLALSDAIIHTQVPNLDILTSGPIPPNPSELLNSQEMNLIMKELKESYEYIVYDTPPVLAVTDPQILGNKCDGVVLVTRSGKTRINRANEAKELLEKAQSHLLGVVINGIESKKSPYFYSQYPNC